MSPVCTPSEGEGTVRSVGMTGRLKTYRKLNALRTRGMAKVWLHVALSILTMNAAAVVNVEGDVRKCVA